MRILNLYAGIGGNRKLWGDEHDITAVEWDEATAKTYQEFFPNDKVIIADAHEYLLEHYDEFDFVWSSPPCPTHSNIRKCGVHSGKYKAKYPDMDLYQEIILLDNFAPLGCKWVVENVNPFYTPLIPSTRKLDRHLYWSNFYLPVFKSKKGRIHNTVTGSDTIYGFNIKDTDISNKVKSLRNMVDPKLGKHILDSAMNIKTESSEQKSLFT